MTAHTKACEDDVVEYCVCGADEVSAFPQINIELLRESLRIMRWHPGAIEFIVAAVEGKKS